MAERVQLPIDSAQTLLEINKECQQEAVDYFCKVAIFDSDEKYTHKLKVHVWLFLRVAIRIHKTILFAVFSTHFLWSFTNKRFSRTML